MPNGDGTGPRGGGPGRGKGPCGKPPKGPKKPKKLNKK